MSYSYKIGRVLEEGLSNLICNKIYSNSEHIAKEVMDMLDLETVDIQEEKFTYPKPQFKEFKIYFYIGTQIYRLYIYCFVLIDKSLFPYKCLVFKGE